MPSVTPIASRANALLVKARKLANDPSAYRTMHAAWLAGEHLCSAYARRGATALHALITEPAWEQPALRDLARTAAAVAVLPQTLMEGIGTLDSAAPLAFVVAWEGPGRLVPGQPSIVLDRLQDAGNVGTILRSAAAFGFTQVAAVKGTAALWSPKVLRAGMGAHFGLRLVEGLDTLERGDVGVPMLATSPHAAQAIHRTALPWPCAWVLGHEGQGVSAPLLQQCDHVLRIPQPGGEESLNAASAAAVCLYESMRQKTRAEEASG